MATTSTKPVSQVVKHESLAEALAAFQANIPTIEKGKKANVGKYSYEYADLSDVTAKVLPLLAAHGLAFTTYTGISEQGQFQLTYALLHTCGEKVEGVYPLPPTSAPPQQMGAAITYARRYALTAVTGVAPGGDDTDAVGVVSAPAPVVAREVVPRVDAPVSASQAQLTALNAGLTRLVGSERSEKLAWLTHNLDREITSSKDVTKQEASLLIDWMNQPTEAGGDV